MQALAAAATAAATGNVMPNQPNLTKKLDFNLVSPTKPMSFSQRPRPQPQQPQQHPKPQVPSSPQPVAASCPSSSSSSSSSAHTAVATVAPVLPSSSKVPVYLRIKPTLTQNKSEDSIIPLEDGTSVRTGQPSSSKQQQQQLSSQEFSFTKVFAGQATQQQVFDEVAGPTVDSFLRHQRDGLIFAYGVTNSGKTFTVQGTRDQPGIIPQALDRIFLLLDGGGGAGSSPVVSVSYLQIYNDQIQDLQDFAPAPQLATSSSGVTMMVNSMSMGGESRRNLKVKVREDSVVVEGLKETVISSARQGMAIIERGNRELRANQDNGLNSSSSRSHTVFIVRLGQAKLHIVDLAGSERGKRTKLSGQRQLEASSINSSLSHLMGCLQAMRSNQKLARLYPDKPQNKPPFRPIPFRECKLTLLFRDCLKASQGVVMIVNASPDPLDFEETQHALRYGEMTRSTALLPDSSAATSVGGGGAGAGSSNNSTAGGKAGGGGKVYGYDGRRRVPGQVRVPLQQLPAPNHQQQQQHQPPQPHQTSQTPNPVRIKSVVVSSPISKSASKAVNKLSLFSNATRASDDQSQRTTNDGRATMVTMGITPPQTPRQSTSQGLEEENYELQRELGQAQRRLVHLEADLREELGRDMERQVKEMEQRYRARLERSQHLEQEESELLRSQQYTHNADMKILAEQVVECEEEMDRMRQSHVREMEALQKELNQALRQQQQVMVVRPSTSAAGEGSTTQEKERADRLARELAEALARVKELEKELEDEMEAHCMVITDRCQVSDELDAALQREAELRQRVEELEQRPSSSSSASSSAMLSGRTPFQLSGSAPNLLLSKRKPQQSTTTTPAAA